MKPDRGCSAKQIATVMAAFLIAATIVSFLQFSQALHPFEDIAKVLDEYPLPKLNYGYHDFQPFIDEQTMKVHHSGHHSAYTKKMNAALKEWRESGDNEALASKSIMEIIRNVEEIPNKWKTALRNNGGGYLNHAIYFSLLSPNPELQQRTPTGKILSQITKSFGNFTTFKEMFTDSALTLFGSGYVWLCRERKNDVLAIIPTVNQESPLSFGLEPILVIDVWEHAYYLGHQNKRKNYIHSWWNVVDWDVVQELYDFWDSDTHDEL